MKKKEWCTIKGYTNEEAAYRTRGDLRWSTFDIAHEVIKNIGGRTPHYPLKYPGYIFLQN